MKNNKQIILEKNFVWNSSSRFPEQVQDTLVSAAIAIQSWLETDGNNNFDFLSSIRQKTGGISWEPSNFLWRKTGFHHVEFHTVFIDPQRITVDTAVHEIAHILDNAMGVHRLASVFGGGPADDMVRAIGAEPDLFLPRFRAWNYEAVLRSLNLELNPTTYGRSMGPAEDFAESFRLAVLQPELLKTASPRRYDWFSIWKNHLIN